MTTHEGPYGTAVQLDINPDLEGANTTVAWWLLTGPWHPFWSQFVICVVSLKPVERVRPAKLHFEGATHELLVLALDPGNPPAVHPAERLVAEGLAFCGYLQPIDVVHQFTATDEEMTQLASLAAAACVDGVLSPSTDDSRTLLREAWLAACVKTLAHMRGETHSAT